MDIEFVGLREAARRVSLSRRTLFKLIESGKLTAFRPTPRKLLIRVEELRRLIEYHPRLEGLHRARSGSTSKEQRRLTRPRKQPTCGR